MMDNKDCPFCRDHESKIKRNSADIQDLWKEIGTMKIMFMVGMGSLLVQLVFFVLDKTIG